MPRARIPAVELERIKCLMECRVLDTSPEQVFDNLTSLAARLCDAPIALVSLVDTERQWFKSTVGIDARETHRDSAFCAHAILGEGPLIVTDTTADPRTMDNPLVLGPPHIRFYAGIPLRTKEGYALGTLCVIDTRSRGITPAQLTDLQSLALQVSSQLELRRLNGILSQSQNQLHEMHTRLTEISSQVPGVVYQFELHPDGHSCFPYASEGIRKIYRVAPEDVRHDASAVFRILHPDDYDEVVESIRISARDLTPWRHEYRVRFPDGDVRWLRGNAIPTLRDDGSIQWHGFITDETNDRLARNEAMLVRSRMQAVVEGSTQLSIIATDLNGIITVFNSGAERLLGYATEEMVGQQTLEIIHVRSEVEARSQELTQEYGYPVAGFETFVHRARLGGHGETDWTYIRKDGSQLAVHLIVTAMRDEHGDITGFVGVAADVTRTRRTEESLRFERERLDMALTGGALGTWDWNIQTGEEIWDARFADLMGERLPDLIPSFAEFSSRVHPEDMPTVQMSVREHFEGLTPIYSAEFRIRRKNGDWRWVQAQGRLMQRDPNGSPLRMLGTMADISARKKIEEELVAARVMADTANRSKSEFLANMSHEIRTPLTSILGYADRISGHDLSDSEIAESVATIKNSGSHLLTIINDVLDLSKIEADRMTVERIKLSPSQLIHEVISVLQPAAQKKGIELHVRSIGAIPKQIVSDPVRIRQILMNLVGNAVKFTERGSVCLTTQIVADSADGNMRMMFEVRDTGIGMTMEQLGKIFEPFMQADASTTRQFGGSGLGLTICSRMAKILDGEIVAESEFGVGSTFKVTVATGPLDDVEMLESLSVVERKSGHIVRSHKNKTLHGRILLAEDNPVNRKLFERILRDAGATVDLAENGQIAVQKTVAAFMPQPNSDCSPPGYDLILMDMQMPVLDGYGATRQLRELRYQGPIVALTAHALTDDRKKCMSFGCDDFITKPIDRDLLIDTCHDWIEYRRMDGCHLENLARSSSNVSLNRSGINRAALLDVISGDIDLMDELMTLFLSNATELLDEIRQAIVSENCHAIQHAAHSLKGTVGTFAAKDALQAAREVEDTASKNNLEGARAAFARLEPVIDNLILDLSAIQDEERQAVMSR